MSHYSGSVPATERPVDWRVEAICARDDMADHRDLFFPLPGDKAAAAAAKQICAACPVRAACLDDALAIEGGRSHDNRYGIRGGLTSKQRYARYSAGKKSRTAQPRQPRTLQSIYDAGTERVSGGHVVWTGQKKIVFEGKVFTPRRLAYLLGRGRIPDGPVLPGCGVEECVLPAHLTDYAERSVCGSTSGYRRHLKEGTEICAPCRQANTDADNLLRRTGTTKVAA